MSGDVSDAGGGASTDDAQDTERPRQTDASGMLEDARRGTWRVTYAPAAAPMGEFGEVVRIESTAPGKRSRTPVTTERGPSVSGAWDLRKPRWRIVVDGRMSPLAFKELETVELAASFLRHMGHEVQVLPA